MIGAASLKPRNQSMCRSRFTANQWLSQNKIGSSGGFPEFRSLNRRHSKSPTSQLAHHGKAPTVAKLLINRPGFCKTAADLEKHITSIQYLNEEGQLD